MIMILTSMPVHLLAANVNHNNLSNNKSKIINKTPVKVAKLEAGNTAADLIKNPPQPKIYTLRTDYKVQRGEKYKVNYQPYIASVGEAATQAEKDKVRQIVRLPDLTGYEKPDDDYKIDYDTVKNAANGNNKTGNDTNGIRYQANKDFKYKAKSNTITIKHVFQDLEDFTKYTNPDGSFGDEGALITTQNGNTGSTMEVSPLNENDPRRKGFVPEAESINMQVPENAENFILEYRYNRAHYDVVFDTAGGTEIPARTLYYEQVIPKIADESIPTKVGGEFQGWKPSVDLKTKDGKTYKANEIIKVGTNEASKNLDANLIMPASKVTFTAVWKDKKKADYAVQFWAEKADHADGASLADKYDYIGTRVYKDKDTGMRPDLDNEPVKNIIFPDLDKARLNKIWNGDRFNRGKDLYLNKFYVYNQALTHDQNKDPANVNLVKSVDSTGKTVYNIYYDRQVYDLYFTKSNAQPEKNTIYPEIWGYDEAKEEQVKKGGPGNLYHYKARFNEMMYKWPNDAKQTKGFTPGYQSFGWGPNYTRPNWPLHLDTPPYRLNADEFLDMANYTNWGGYTKKIDKGDGTTMDLDSLNFTTLSFGIKQDKPSIPHHMDFWMDGFKKGETIIRYDLVRTKADTAGLGYGHRYPQVTGFTPYGYNPRSAWPAIAEGSQENGRVDEEEINDLNDERDEITPNNSGTYYNNYGNKLPIGQLDFISVFFSDADEFGDPLNDEDGNPIVKPFEKNGYLRFKYTRNKYPLRFNYDPSKIKDDKEFGATNSINTFYEFPLKALSPNLVDDKTPREEREYYKNNPKNLLDNPENLKKLGLTDLVFNDPNDENKLKVKRPDNLSDQMVFKGWALDPAGSKLIWKNPKETMPFHPVNLYAKWGEPDYKWKVTFDPNGGSLRNIKEEKLTTSRKKIQEGDIGQEEINTYAKKEANEGDKQIFTVIQRQKLVEPKYKPTRKGYDFMGWEVIRYKKNAQGDYTDEIDNSYRNTYKVPELYSFGNDVVAPVYLKAIWVPNARVDVKVEHYMLDKNYKLVKKLEDTLEAKRADYLVATTGDKQDDEYILAPHEELEKKLTGDLKTTYEEYNKRVKGDNTFFQQFRVEPAQILNTETNKLEDNPKVTDNIFKFFYIPFRQREYKVNYIDERFKGNETQEGAAIIDQELVTNGNRHYDARNYRPIPGWKLVGDPQQQLFFDVDEETNEFLGINGTGKDEITFYYKDVRVIEVPNKNDPVPDGYVRVTYKADKGGSFGKDKDGNDIKELNYDVIKGLKSDLLPVPKELKEGETVDQDKHYITPDDGRKFTKWDKSPLLNKNTIIDANHTFTAYFEWSGLSASGIVRTEAFKDDKKYETKDWSNNFAPTIEELKKQLVWREKDQVKDLPAGAEIKLFGADGNELTSDDQVYELVNEKNKADKDQLVRTVNVKAKVAFKEGKEPQELDIPITVYKNVYEALNKDGDKPLFLKEAEGKEAKDGGLKDVTGNYVKVTVQPTEKNTNKDAKVYYVNPKAWVNIPEVAWSEADKDKTDFLKWTADKDAQNEKDEKGKSTGVFDFSKRHKFTEETLIKPVFTNDVVEQKEGEDKPKVPDNFVKVVVDKTSNAVLGQDEKQTQTFWVSPTKEVTIPVASPTGKTEQEVEIAGLGKKKVNYVFKEWQKVQTGEADDKLTEVKPAAKIDLSKNKYTDKVTVIEAVYKKSIVPGELVPAPVAKKNVLTPKGDTPKPEDLIENIPGSEKDPLPNGTKITYEEEPNIDNPGDSKAKVKIEYPNGKTVVVEVPIKVVDNVVPQTGKDKPLVPEGYVKVVVDTTEKATANTKFEKTFWVKPNVEVTIPDILAPTGKTEVIDGVTKKNNFVKWQLEGTPKKTYDKEIKDKFTAEESKIVATYESGKNVEPKGKNNQWIPQGSNPSPKDFIENPYNDDDPNSKDNLPPGTKIEFAEGKQPDTNTPGKDKEATIKITYPNGETKEVPVKYNVTGDVAEQKDKDKKPEVPDDYVKVVVKTTDKATDETKFERTFWVKPTKEVTIPITEPTGKENQKVTIDGLGEKDVNYIFKEWQKVQTGEADDKLTEVKPAAKIDLSKNKYTDKVTVIEAVYKKSIVPGELVPAPVAKKNVLTPKGDTPKPEDLIENIPGSEKDPLPNGTKITYEEEPNIDNPGDSKAKVKIEYPNGKTVVVEVPIKVVDNVVPQTGKDKPLVPEGYVKVVVDTTEKATANTKFEKTFWVKPNVEVTIPDILAPTGKQEKIGEVTKTNKFVKWKLEGSKPEKFFETKITDTFKDKESKIVATYEFGKNVEPKGKNNQWIPQGSNPSPKDFIENPYNDDDPNNKDNLPPGTKIEFAEGKQPDTNTPGKDKEATIKITYPNGETKEVPVKYNVTGDVVEQKEGEDKPKVPDNFVKVIVKTTDKATDDTKFEKTFWVKPNKEVTIPVNNPEGKSEDKKKYEFDSWTWENVDTKDKIKGTFTKDTVIVAQYKTTTKAKDIEQIPEVVSEIPIVSLNQSDIDKDWFKIKNKNDTDSKIKIVEITEKPATDSLGIQSGKAKVTFKNGSSRIITIKLKVVDDVIESKGDKKTNDVPDNYKLVILDSTSDALEQTKRYFWINPNKDITLKAFKPQGKAGKVFDKWERSLSINWNKEGITENVLTIKAIYKDETTPDQPGGQPGEVEKHGHRYIERVAGKDRVHTAINTSRRFFNKSRYVIIADSGNYPDALTATVLAHVLDAPILLNNTRYLEDDVAREIVRLGASEVIIVGGHKSISENVKSQLARYDQNSVQRIWGRDRYVTSSELAYEIQRLTGKVNKAIIASGENFPDALATAPLGSKEIAPILLVRRNQIDKKVDKALKDLNIKRVYVAGGPNSVSKKLEGQLPQVIRRFNGRDRYETAVLVASYTYPESKEVFVASGEVFPDALVIGPVCARRKAPILLSRTTPVKVTDDYIEKSNIEYLYIIGGTNTIYAETAHKYAIED